MTIDGKPVLASGTLVIDGGEVGAIHSPAGVIQLNFKSDSSGQRVDVSSDGTGIDLFNADSGIGNYFRGTLSGGGGSITFRIAVYTYSSGARAIHYTIT